MATGGDEWIYVSSSCQDEAAEEEKAPTKNSDLDVQGSHLPPAPSSSHGDDDEAASTKTAGSSGEEDDDGSGSTYGSTEVNDYLSGIEGGADDEEDEAGKELELDLDLEGLLNLKIGDDGGEAPAANAAAEYGCFCEDCEETCGYPPRYGLSSDDDDDLFGSHDRYGTDYDYYNTYHGSGYYGDAYYGYGSYYDDVYPYAPAAPRYPPPLVYRPTPPAAYGATVTMQNMPAPVPYMYNSQAAPPYMYYHYAAPVPASRYFAPTMFGPPQVVTVRKRGTVELGAWR